MPRRALKIDQARSKIIHARVNEETYNRMADEAKAAGLTISKFAADLFEKRRIVVEQRETMDAGLFAQLQRIGNNINQLARARNRGREPDRRNIILEFKSLFELLMRDELMRRRLDGISNDNRSNPDGSSTAPARQQLQGRERLSASR